MIKGVLDEALVNTKYKHSLYKQQSLVACIYLIDSNAYWGEKQLNLLQQDIWYRYSYTLLSKINIILDSRRNQRTYCRKPE